MKKFAIFVMLLLGSNLTKAQLVPSSQASDFSASSVTGQEIHLNSLLAEDKVVLLVFFSSASQNAWNYQQSQQLQQLYSAHGPAGDDKLEILLIESDPSTNVDCILGSNTCNGSTYGNWLSGISYPVINSDTIANLYDVDYYPCIRLVCPGRRAYKMLTYTGIYLWEEALKCPISVGGMHDVALFDFVYRDQYEQNCGSFTVQPEVKLINLGNMPLTEASIKLQLDSEDVQTVFWSGFLEKYETTCLEFSPLLIPKAGELSAVAQINVPDVNMPNNSLRFSFGEAPDSESSTVQMKVRPDNYAYEVYWEIRDAFGSVLAKQGNNCVGPDGGGRLISPNASCQTAYQNNTTYKKTIQLPGAGCYTLVMVDAGGDGIQYNAGGYYRLHQANDNGPVLIEGAQYGAYQYHRFTVGGTVGTTQANTGVQHFQVSPNPANEYVHFELAFDDIESFSVDVFNYLGVKMDLPEQVFAPTQQAGWDLYTANWPAGHYQAVLRLRKGTVAKNFSIFR